MSLAAHFQMLARYNRLANEELYAVCAQLDDAAYRRRRPGSFGSIHALLNHMLLADRIWMARFEGGGKTTLPLDSVLYEDFATLRSARAAEDSRIESLFAHPALDFFERTLTYINSRGKDSASRMLVAVPHFFNHQTHHRGQVHVMLRDAGLQPPSLDLHRLMQP